MPQATWSTLLAVIALGASACSDEGNTQGAPEPQLVDENGQPLPEGTVECSSDPRLGEYLGLDTPGDIGTLSFRLEQMAPAPLARGTNTLQVHIQDANGAPMVGELRVDPRMPDHGHGSPVQPRVMADDSGQYTVEQLVLFMLGIWRIDLEVRADGVPVDRKSFFFCVEG